MRTATMARLLALLLPLAGGSPTPTTSNVHPRNPRSIARSTTSATQTVLVLRSTPAPQAPLNPSTGTRIWPFPWQTPMIGLEVPRVDLISFLPLVASFFSCGRQLKTTGLTRRRRRRRCMLLTWLKKMMGDRSEEEEEPTKYPFVLRQALRLVRDEEGVTVVSQESAVAGEEWDDESLLHGTCGPLRALLGALVRAETSLVAPAAPRPSRVRFAVEELGAVDFVPESDQVDQLLEHLTSALAAGRAARGSREARQEAARLASALESVEVSASHRSAAAFLALEVRALCSGQPSTVASRHAEALSSVIRKELKKQVNRGVAIVPGTGSVRFNFDDPAALLHRALDILHEQGGPSWPQARGAEAGDFTFDSRDDAEEVVGLASAHGFVLGVLRHPAVLRQRNQGSFDRLADLASLVSQTCGDDGPPRKKLRTLAPAPAAPSALASLAPLADLAALKDRLTQAAPLAEQWASHAIRYIEACSRQSGTNKPKRSRKRKLAHVSRCIADDISLLIFPELIDAS